MSEQPAIGGRAPLPIEVTAGEEYWWCACGRSKSQPFCDGSHEGTGLRADAVHRAREQARVLLHLQAHQDHAALRRLAQRTSGERELMPDLLLELFSEEIPARMQAKAADDLRRMVTDKLVAEGLVYEGAKAFATPRRLALTVHGIPARQPDLKEERKGPQVGGADAADPGIFESHRPHLARMKPRSRTTRRAISISR